jgi:hypothetical protein
MCITVEFGVPVHPTSSQNTKEMLPKQIRGVHSQAESDRSPEKR